MNKEEIEKAKIGLWNIRTDCLKIMQCGLSDKQDKEECLKEIDTIDDILKYIKELEQKESILNKVTDKLKEDIEKYNKEIIRDNTLSIASTNLAARVLQSQKILNIIEGEKK